MSTINKTKFTENGEKVTCEYDFFDCEGEIN